MHITLYCLVRISHISLHKMLKYRDKVGSPEVQITPDPTAHRDKSEIPNYMSIGEQYGFSDDMDIGGSTDNGAVPTVEQEYQAYITAPLSSKTVNILKFWEVSRSVSQVLATDKLLQVNGGTFPTLFTMAMDYLPVQATSVPSERVFSSSSKTTTRRRNQINNLLMEALQIRKFRLMKDRLDFMAGWKTKVKQMVEDDPDSVDVLQKLFETNHDAQNTFDSIMKRIAESDSDVEEEEEES